MMSAADSLPDDVEALKSLLRDRDAELMQARTTASNADALIAHLQLAIEKLRRELYGVRSERKARLIEQMELELEELEADASEDELTTGKEAKTTAVHAFSRKKPSRQPFPAHLPRERVVLASPVATTNGSSLLRSLTVMGRRDDMGDASRQRDAWPTARAST
jgi:transposase